jgi:hypothetical protein
MTKLQTVLDELAADAPVGKASWENVLARARSLRRRRLRVAAAIGALVAIVLATPAFGVGKRLLGFSAGTPVETTQLSSEQLHVLGAMTEGRSPRVPASKEADLRRVRLASLRQIAVRDGHTYFAANKQGGGMCVAIGKVNSSHLFGSLTCTPDFPSASRPLLDESTWTGSGELRVSALEGFADDSIVSVGVLLGDGGVTAVTPVENNVYLRTADLPSEPVAGIVGLGENGETMYTQCMAPGGCPRPN